MCTYIDRNRIELATKCISLHFLGLYQCCHGHMCINTNKYVIDRRDLLHRFAISVATVKQIPLGVSYLYNYI